MIRIIIIENEPAPAERLVSLLKGGFPDIEILEVCETVEKSLSAIRKYSPDLVFIDVELNNGENGFEILKKVDKIDFEIIVTTSYDKYAVQACKASVLDFLLKPIPKDELVAAVEKYKNRKNKGIDPKQVELFLEIFQNATLTLRKFALPTMNGLDFIETSDIVYFEGADNQVSVHLKNGETEIITMLLKECEKLLSQSNFCRIHKSYLINLNHVEKYYKGKVGIVILSNGQELDVSRNYKDDFLHRFRGKGR